MEIVHEPVLIGAIIDLLKNNNLNESPVVIDGTLGLGGYAEEVLKNFEVNKLFGIDRDDEALKIAAERLNDFKNFQALHGEFGDLKNILLNIS